MDTVVRNDILNLLDEAIKLLSKKGDADLLDLKDLSNLTLENAVIYEDPTLISLAVGIYALSKTIERNQNAVWPKVLRILIKAHSYLSQNKERDFEEEIKALITEISRFDKKLRNYVGEVLAQAKVKKGSKFFDKGLSLAKASELLGISQWELHEYVGQTTILEDWEKDFEEEDVLERLEFARGLFK